MRNPEQWKPTKLHFTPGANGAAPHIRVPADAATLGAGSTLIATLAARWYGAALAEHAHGTLLELGAGAMPYFGLYRSRVSTVWCTDWPASLHRQPHADLLCDLNCGIPLQAAVADTLIAADVLEHIYQPQALLAEMARVLRPGGTVLLNTPFMYWVHESPHDYFRYTQHALERLACDAGLQPLRVDPLGGAACVLADIAGKLLQGRRPLGAWLARTLQRGVLGLHRPLPQSASSPLLMAAVLRKPP